MGLGVPFPSPGAAHPPPMAPRAGWCLWLRGEGGAVRSQSWHCWEDAPWEEQGACALLSRFPTGVLTGNPQGAQGGQRQKGVSYIFPHGETEAQAEGGPAQSQPAARVGLRARPDVARLGWHWAPTAGSPWRQRFSAPTARPIFQATKPRPPPAGRRRWRQQHFGGSPT